MFKLSLSLREKEIILYRIHENQDTFNVPFCVGCQF